MNAVITGGTKGIGQAIAENLMSEGHNIGFCARSEKEIDLRIQEWQETYPELDIVGRVCDVSDQSQVEAFGREMIDHFGRVEVLVNNAGVFIPGELLKEEEGALEKMMQTNLYSAYHLTRVIAPQMVSAKSGHIFNMCSVASQIAYPNGGSYSISKFALLGFSKVLREELKSHHVKVTSILPGATWSDSWAGVDLPAERLMQARDVAIAIGQALKMSPSAVVEEIVMRPQLGDL